MATKEKRFQILKADLRLLELLYIQLSGLWGPEPTNRQALTEECHALRRKISSMLNDKTENDSVKRELAGYRKQYQTIVIRGEAWMNVGKPQQESKKRQRWPWKKS